jgi:hypothetical protein
MKYYVEIILVALLLGLLYEKPEFLVRFSNSTLGKLLTVVLIVLISQSSGLNAGLLSALIVIVLRQTWIEGYTEYHTPLRPSKFSEKGLTANGDEVETQPKKIATTKADSTSPKDAGKKLCGTKQKWDDNLGKCISVTDQLKVEDQIGERSSHKATLEATKQNNMQTNN